MNEQTKFIVRELQPGFRNTKFRADGKITSSASVVDFVMNIWKSYGDIDFCERMLVVHMKRNNEILGYHLVSKGGVAGTVADPKVMFSTALVSGASSIILVHNHPSGNLDPSGADRTLTDNMKSVGKMLELPVLDHCIITENSKGKNTDSYYSFADNGML